MRLCDCYNCERLDFEYGGKQTTLQTFVNTKEKNSDGWQVFRGQRSTRFFDVADQYVRILRESSFLDLELHCGIGIIVRCCILYTDLAPFLDELMRNHYYVIVFVALFMFVFQTTRLESRTPNQVNVTLKYPIYKVTINGSGHFHRGSKKAVAVTGSIQPDAAQADHFTVKVELDINDGWHTYDEVGEGSEEPTSLELELPKGVTTKGDWRRPTGIAGTEKHSLIYEGQVSFSRSVIVEPSAYGKRIDVTVSYQACTDEYCNRPQSKAVSIPIPKKVSSSSSIFSRPVRLSVDGALLAGGKTRFLSPAIFDVDGDGKAELVIGSLKGTVDVYENLNTSGTGDPVWGPKKVLKDIKGKRIRTANW